MKRLIGRIMQSEAGETLVETLASILVSTLAITALTTAVVVAGGLNQQANVSTVQVDYQQVYAARSSGYGDDRADAGKSSSGVVGVTDPLNADYSQNGLAVAVYGGDDLVSYRLEED